MSNLAVHIFQQKENTRMKKQLVTALVLVGLTAAVGYAAPTALPGQGVKNSVHDMAAAVGAVDFGSNGRICAFCHTPHHAQTVGTYAPLWSRSNSNATTTYAPYVSATFNATLQPGFLDAAAGPTRLCMSCHDGSIAPDQHYGQAGASALLTNDTFGGAGVGASNNLGNDHPLGFDYVAVAAGPTTGDVNTVTAQPESGMVKNYIRQLNSAGTDLKYADNALQITVAERLYNGSIMTCATCHDVHNKKNKFSVADTATFNYLVLAPQNGSSLCLTCHIK